MRARRPARRATRRSRSTRRAARRTCSCSGSRRRTNPTTFDVENRLWPRPQDPNVDGAGGHRSAASCCATTSSSSRRCSRSRAPAACAAGEPGERHALPYPNEYLYSSQRPQAIYRLRLRYESEGGREPATIALGSLQLRPGSERLTAYGPRARARASTTRSTTTSARSRSCSRRALFPTPTAVTVRYEENPLFVTQPTSVFGARGGVPDARGHRSTSPRISQSQRSTLQPPAARLRAGGRARGGRRRRPRRGTRRCSRAPRRASRVVARAALAGDTTPMPAARITLHGEFAASKPRARARSRRTSSRSRARAGLSLPLERGAWYFVEPAADGRRAAQRGWRRAAHARPRGDARVAEQRHAARRRARRSPTRITDIDPPSGSRAAGFVPPEPVLWLTLYPLRVGGLPRGDADGGAERRRASAGRWRERADRAALALDPHGAQPGRRRPVARRDARVLRARARPDDARRGAQPDARVRLRRRLGELGRVRAGDADRRAARRRPPASTRSTAGAASPASTALDTERDPLSRVFNAAVNDRRPAGRPRGRRWSSSTAARRAGARASGVPLCRAQLGAHPRVSATRGELHGAEQPARRGGHRPGRAAQPRPTRGPTRERIRRFVVDLSDPRASSRASNCGACQRRPGDARRRRAAPARRRAAVLGAGARPVPRADRLDRRLQRAPRARAAPDDGLRRATSRTTRSRRIALARLRLVGAPWLRRTDRAADRHRAATRPARSASFVVACVVGTQDSTARVPYQPPPGVTERPTQRRTGLETDAGAGERALAAPAGRRAGRRRSRAYERAEAYFRFPEGAKNLMTLPPAAPLDARRAAAGGGRTGSCNAFVKLGRDENNFYCTARR